MLKDSGEMLFNAMRTRKGKGYETYVLGEFLGGALSTLWFRRVP